MYKYRVERRQPSVDWHLVPFHSDRIFDSLRETEVFMEQLSREEPLTSFRIIAIMTIESVVMGMQNGHQLSYHQINYEDR